MAEDLYLRIQRDTIDASSAVDWMLLDDVSGVARSQGRDPLSSVAETWSAERRFGDVIVLVPGEDVLITTATVPSRKRRQIVQALPFAIEERIASDVEDMHFAIGERLGKGDIAVAVVERAVMAHWVELLNSAGLSPQVMVPDSLCVPLDGDAAAIQIADGRALVRTAPSQGLAVESALLGTLLQLVENGGELAEAGRRVNLLVDRETAEALDLEITQWQAELEGRLQKVISDYPAFETLCRGYSSRATNLLQGDFEAQHDRHGKRVNWAAVAMAAGAVLLLHFALMTGRGVWLNFEAARFQEEAEALYAAVFPADRNVRDLRRRWQGHLSGPGTTGDAAGFLPILREAAKALGGSGIEVDNINFNDQRGDVVLQVRAGSSDQLVAYSQRLTQVGLAAEIGAINQGDAGVNGSVRISAGRGG